jgi:putative flavoprotein involved in K+ transport
VIGRVAGATDGSVAIHPNANQILDDADTAYDTFLSAARQLTATEISEELTDEQLIEAPRRPAAVDEVDSLNLTRNNIQTIIWATGYTYDFGWIKLPVFDQHGRPAQHRGVTQRPGLYFLGLHWMHTFKSGLLAGVGSDAEYLADHMTQTR